LTPQRPTKSELTVSNPVQAEILPREIKELEEKIRAQILLENKELLDHYEQLTRM
jgi:hypothetical protein